MENNKVNVGIKVLIIILILLIIGAGILLAMKIITDNKLKSEDTGEDVISLGSEEGIGEVEQEPEEVVFDIYNGNDRPIAIMIDNHKGAWPQAGLNEAYIVYEIIVEGGETRLMPIFKGKDLAKIGPVRSSRHYYLDYALENDAIYVHYGWSPQAQSDISTYKVNNINGISESTKSFWRVKDKKTPHNVATSTAKILEIAANKKYRTTSNDTSVLNYTKEEVNLEEGSIANKVTIPYSTLHTVSYTYNAETQRYERYARGVKQTDWDTKEVISTKNIIITFAENYKLDDVENKDRQGLKNIGTLKGYYITNGKAIQITCTKKSRTEKTEYKDLQGNVINVNDGNTFIQICPINAKVVIE